MRTFTCERCGQLLFFENSRCLRCHAELGFDDTELDLVVLDEHSELRPCANRTIAECNWMLAPQQTGPLCTSCALTKVRPADDDAQGLERFAAAEAAKRRLIYQLLDLGLPIDRGLQFDLLEPQGGEGVVTGQADGLITLDLTESDNAKRAARQAELGEPYRTLLGHFRHEVGHYYFPILVSGDELAPCRALFGDDREDYQAAMDRHYKEGAPEGWQSEFISSYATMHPYEDWAETFANYLHIRDTLETSAAFRMRVAGPQDVLGEHLSSAPDEDTGDEPFSAIVAEWLPLTYALNAINRSMGESDLYPYVLADPVIGKLAYVHQRVQAFDASTTD